MSLQLQAQRQSIAQVRDWYEATAESILAHRGAILEALRLGHIVSVRFFGLTAEEIDRKFAQQREELDNLSILNLMTSAEATVRDDYHERVKNRYRDRLSQAYRTYHRNLSAFQKRHPPLDDGILEVLRTTELVAAHYIGDFRDMLRLRQWLAHGRWWILNLGKSSYAFDDVYRTVDTLLGELDAE
jgi:hypothetical protein